MSSRRDQYGDEPYREDEDEDRRWLPFYPSWGWGGGWGLPIGARRAEVRADEEADDGVSKSSPDEGSNGSLWDEGLITLLIVGGVILFLFPEPATSALGVVLLFVGAIAGLIDWAL